MSWKAGSRFKSAVCNAEGVIVRPPASGGQLECGGAPVLEAAQGRDITRALGEANQGAAVAGKRYLDETSGLEVLCTKAGFGGFGFAGRSLELKQAKALPASD